MLKNSFTTPPVDSGVILTKVDGASALAKLVPQVALSGNGTVFHTWETGNGALVGEGELKPMTSTAAKSIEMGAHKVTIKFTMSDEVLEDVEGLKAAIYEKFPQKLVSDIDFRVIGDRIAPSENFANLSDVETAEISDVASLYAALSAVGDKGVSAEGILITSGMLLALKGQRYSTGVPMFNIDAETIEGIPYAVVNSPVKQAIVGPFATRAVWGVVPGYPKVQVETSAFTLDNGDILTLADHNLVGFIVETRVGFAVADKSEFLKLTLPAVAGVAARTAKA